MLYSRFSRVFVVSLLMLATCGISSWYIYSVFGSWASYDAKEVALQETQELILATQKPIDHSAPYFAIDACWRFLQKATYENANQYTLDVSYYNQDDPNYNWRDVDEVTVDINFADGRKAVISYYEGGMVSCVGYDVLASDEINSLLKQYVQTELPQSAVNNWGTGVYISSTAIYIKFSTTPEDLTAFLHNSPFLPDNLRLGANSEHILNPYYINDKTWLPTTLQQVHGIEAQWEINDQSISGSVIAGIKTEVNAQEVYLRLLIENSANQ